ncbi:YtzH-like family protein [Siminovitchia sediminis]|uniref:YtzH-like family protein n=1 Tax=Siminovitchia sediminis TaxID=1274353 RepID=A0ABW4KKU1_9BACI
MPLSYHDQIGLLKDIMVNHLEDLQGSVSECTQIGRLVKSLLANQEVHPELTPVLEEIYFYCQTGSRTKDLTGHIDSHQEHLSHWIGNIDQYT